MKKMRMKSEWFLEWLQEGNIPCKVLEGRSLSQYVEWMERGQGKIM